QRNGDGRVARGPPEGAERQLPRTAIASAARARPAADAELRRDAELRTEARWRSGRQAGGRPDPHLRARGVARRRGVIDRAAARDDARLGEGHEAGSARRAHPALGRHRERRRSHRGPRPSARMNLAIAFGAGILSFVSPCVLPLVPAYLVNLAGESALSGTDRRRTIAHAIAFVVGFSAVFTLLWVGIALLGTLGAEFVTWLQRIAGVVLVVLGMHMLGLITIPFLEQTASLDLDGSAIASGSSYRRSVLIGVAFGAGWTPCIGPYLALILTILLNNDVAAGAVRLLAYSLGLGVPFLLVA